MDNKDSFLYVKYKITQIPQINNSSRVTVLKSAGE